MRIVSWNVNGIRAAIRKGIERYVDCLEGDIWMLQEVRALPEQLPKDWTLKEGFASAWHPAKKKGYAGVATWAQEPMRVISRGMGRGEDPEDSEGRVLVTQHKGVRCINTYAPSGAAKVERQSYKERWMDEWLDWLRPALADNGPVVVAGDFNVAHQEIDIWNPRGNQHLSGFLPHERDWFTALLATGWHDLCRLHFGAVQGPYSWWSNRGRARLDDKGWRIDYILGNDAARQAFRQARIVRSGGLEISDHAPIVVDFDIG